MTTIYLWLLWCGGGVLLLTFILDMILTATIPDKKAGDIVCYVLYSLASVALFGAGAIHVGAREEIREYWGDKFFSINRRAQSEWIRENVPDDLWDDAVLAAFNREYKRIDSILVLYGNKAIETYIAKCNRGMQQTRNALSLFGWEGLYDMLGNDSDIKAAESTSDRYVELKEKVCDQLGDDLQEMYDKKDSLIGLPYDVYSERKLFLTLLGTPDKMASLSGEQYHKLVHDTACRLVNTTPRPEIVSLEYDRKRKCWMMMTGEKYYAVRLEKDQYGLIDYHIGPSTGAW